MNVGMFVDKPLPSDRPTGIGVAAFNMALALSRRGINVHLVCRGETEKTTSVNNHLAVQTIRHFSRDNLAAFRGILREGGCEIIHAHSSSAIPSLIAARALGRSVALHAHGDEPLHPIRLTIMRNLGMTFSHRVIATSEYTREEIMTNHRVPSKKVVVAYNGVDIEDFSPSAAPSFILSKYGLDGFGTIVLSLGAIQKRKGQWMMIECLPRILQRWPKLGYVVVGAPYDQSYQRRLLERAAELGVTSSVKLLGTVSKEDLVHLVNAADVCVHPSAREGFGLAVVEEMACGKAVVAFNVDSLPEIIDDGVDGLLVDPNNKDELTRVLSDVIGDKVFAKRLGDAARKKVVERFTWDQSAASLERIYAQLLS